MSPTSAVPPGATPMRVLTSLAATGSDWPIGSPPFTDLVPPPVSPPGAESFWGPGGPTPVVAIIVPPPVLRRPRSGARDSIRSLSPEIFPFRCSGIGFGDGLPTPRVRSRNGLINLSMVSCVQGQEKLASWSPRCVATNPALIAFATIRGLLTVNPSLPVPYSQTWP